MAGQRTDFLTWDEFFMSVVCLAGIKGMYLDDGACIVDKNGKILSIGSTCFPYTIQNSICVGAYDFCTNSVFNALYNFKGNRKEFENGTIYLSHFPSKEDAQKIAQARFARVVYLTKQFSDDVDDIVKEEVVSRRILAAAGTKIESYFLDGDFPEYHEFLNNFKSILKKNIGKEDGVLTEAEYFMSLAILSSLRSKDPSTQVGACLVDEDGRILSVGYNGAPFGMDDNELPWHSNGEEFNDIENIKNSYVVHAEANTLDNYRGQQDDLKGKRMFLTLSPCYECTQRLSMISLEKIVWLINYTKMHGSYELWFGKTKTDFNTYFQDRDFTKKEYQEFVSDLTILIKQFLGKGEFQRTTEMPKMKNIGSVDQV